MTFVVVGCVGGCFVIEIEVAPVCVASRLDDGPVAMAAPTGEWLGSDAR